MRRIFSIILAIIGIADLFLAGLYLKYNIVNHLNHGTGPASWSLTAKILFVGFILFFVAYWLWNSVETVAKRAERLKKSGHFVMAKYIRNVDLLQQKIAVIEVKGIAGVMVETSYIEPSNNRSWWFYSPTVWELPNPIPHEIKVYVNPKNLSDYHMDIGLTLPEMLQKHKGQKTA